MILHVELFKVSLFLSPVLILKLLIWVQYGRKRSMSQTIQVQC